MSNEQAIKIAIAPHSVEREFHKIFDQIQDRDPQAMFRQALRHPESSKFQYGDKLFFRSTFNEPDLIERAKGPSMTAERISAFSAAIKETVAMDEDEISLDAVIVIADKNSEAALAFAYEAIMPGGSTPDLFFVSEMNEMTRRLAIDSSPTQTLVVVISEKLGEGKLKPVIDYFVEWTKSKLGEAGVKKFFCAVTSDIEGALNLGVSRSQIFSPLDDHDGTDALFSTRCLPLEICLPVRAIDKLRAGAATIDRYMFNVEPRSNSLLMTVALELATMKKSKSRVFNHIAFDDRLLGLGSHIRNHVYRAYAKTKPPLFLDTGSDIGVTSFVQSLPKLTLNDIVYPMDLSENQDVMEAPPMREPQMMLDSLSENGHPIISIGFEKVTPYAVGALAALYEYRYKLVEHYMEII